MGSEPSAVTVAIDLGHHRAFAAIVEHHAAHNHPAHNGTADNGTADNSTADNSTAAYEHQVADIVQLSANTDGLLLRSSRSGRSIRTMEAIAAAANDAPHLAKQLSHELAERVRPSLVAAGIDLTVPPRWRIGVPLAWPPAAKRALCDGFAEAGMPLDEVTFVERVVAAAAAWSAHGTTSPPRYHEQLPQQHLPRSQWGAAAATNGASSPSTSPSPSSTARTLIIDNDAGVVSALVVDTEAQSLLAIAHLATPSTATNDAAVMEQRLFELLDGSTDVATVVLTGSGASHRGLQHLIRQCLPHAELVASPLLGDHSLTVVGGLASPAALLGYTAAWPTLDLTLGPLLLRPAGPFRAAEPTSFVLTTGSVLCFARERRRIPAVHGQHRANGITVPSALGSFPTLHLGRAGQLILGGAQTSLRLTIDVAWPAPGAGADHVVVRSVANDSVANSSVANSSVADNTAQTTQPATPPTEPPGGDAGAATASLDERARARAATTSSLVDALNSALTRANRPSPLAAMAPPDTPPPGTPPPGTPPLETPPLETPPPGTLETSEPVLPEPPAPPATPRVNPFGSVRRPQPVEHIEPEPSRQP